MSDLQRDFIRQKLSKLPPPTSLFPPLEDDEPLQITTTSISTSTTHTISGGAPPSPTSPTSSSASTASTTSINTIRAPSPSSRSALHPLPWSDFFDEQRTVRVLDGREFNVYVLKPGTGGLLYAMHHGAGSSGLSFAVLARELRRADPRVGVLAVDCRCHGQTDTGGEELDFELDTLSREFAEVVKSVVEDLGTKEVILVGHSLGGAVVVDVAKSGVLGKTVVGYAVFDVVEGSAVEALGAMGKYLEGRPAEFKGLEEGIDWHLRSHTLRNTTSARVSVPALLKPTSSSTYTWRTNLALTQPFWSGWFKGLSSKFLSARGGKLLVLAGTDRLDKELMIGQMMGKYQLVVLPETGHFLHEDLPVKVAEVLTEFAKRQAPIVLPPKVSQGYGL